MSLGKRIGHLTVKKVTATKIVAVLEENNKTSGAIIELDRSMAPKGFELDTHNITISYEINVSTKKKN